MKLGIKLFVGLIFLSVFVKAQDNQPAVIFRGKILFERKMNIHKQIDEMAKNGNQAMMEQMKKRIDPYKVDKFEYDFTTEKSLYKPAKDGISEMKMMWGNAPAERNEVYTDFVGKSSMSKKEIYDKEIMLKDSLISYKWKIKNEYKTIAGYNCRRAETIIMDSVWVIAFYTDGIIASGGPESFNGLPGTILGVVMPRLNVTYFATEVQNFTNELKPITAPTSKAKVYNHKELEDYLRANMKQWGTYVDRALWYVKI